MICRSMYDRPNEINLENCVPKFCLFDTLESRHSVGRCFVGRYSLFRGFSGSVFRGSALAWVAETRLEEQVESRDKDSEI